MTHSVANGEKRSVILLSAGASDLSPIPAAKTLLAFAGLNSLLPCDHWHLSIALSAAWTGQVNSVYSRTIVLCDVQFFLACPSP